MMKEEALILLAFSQTGLSSSVFPVEKKKNTYTCTEEKLSQ